MKVLPIITFAVIRFAFLAQVALQQQIIKL